jgi:acetyltransferase-like isoleucine patch superfamily enzyme
MSQFIRINERSVTVGQDVTVSQNVTIYEKNENLFTAEPNVTRTWEYLGT